MYCNKKYKNVVTLTFAMKEAWEEITLHEVGDMCSAMPYRIKAVVLNDGGDI